MKEQPATSDATMAQRPLDAGALFRAHMPFVASFLVRLGVRRDDVQDLVQEVFLVAHRRGGYVPGPARPTTWLAEIAMRVAAAKLRTQRRRAEDPDGAAVDAVPTRAANPAEAAETAQLLACVDRALATLDLDRRAVFVLFEIEGEPCDAIAAALGVPITTIYSRLHSARVRFTEAFERLVDARRPAPLARAARARA